MARLTFTPLQLQPSFEGCESQEPTKTGRDRVPLAVCGAGSRLVHEMSGCVWRRSDLSYHFAPLQRVSNQTFSRNICTAVPDVQGSAVHHNADIVYSLTHSQPPLLPGSRQQWYWGFCGSQCCHQTSKQECWLGVASPERRECQSSGSSRGSEPRGGELDQDSQRELCLPSDR